MRYSEALRTVTQKQLTANTLQKPSRLITRRKFSKNKINFLLKILNEEMDMTVDRRNRKQHTSIKVNFN